MSIKFNTPLSELGLATEILEILARHHIVTYDNLACVMMRDLVSMGLSNVQIGEIIACVKNFNNP